jgi:cyclopropane fatty-acyl-phospholipid synthase-like methyltransferase
MPDDEGIERTQLDRASWLGSVRRANELQEDELDPTFDQEYGEITDLHRRFVASFLSSLTPGGAVLDAACGTGKYFGMVLESGRTVVGVDQSGAHLRTASEKYPTVRVEKHDLQDLPFRSEFDGVMCVDAMEFVPPEDWPVVLGRFRGALRGSGRLYLTVELHDEEALIQANEQTRGWGFPVVDGEVIWDGPEGYYHFHPSVPRVRSWITDAGFAIDEEFEGPWDEDYAYHHILAHTVSSIPTT